jgi:GNAT superfamily N-acetyltransferase
MLAGLSPANEVEGPKGPAGRIEAVEIRPPHRSELRACRLILPEAFGRVVVPDLLLAVGRQPIRFLGALAYAAVLFEGNPSWRLALHVVRGYRRRGIGTQLVRSLIGRTAGRGVRALIAPQPAEEPEAARFLGSLGFQHAFRSSVYEGELEHYRAAVGPLCERLRGRGKVPPGARAVPLQDAPRDGLAQLLAEHARRTPHSLGDPWAEVWLRPSAREASAVLMLGDQVIGAILAEKHGPLAEVIWRVVAPPYRGGWANIVLNAATWDRMARSGVRRVRFTTTTHTPDTERFVRLYGAAQATTTDQYVLRLGAVPH